MRKMKINKRNIIALIIIASIVVSVFGYMVYEMKQNYNFALQMEKLCSKNQEPVFCIDKIITYSSANAIDNSEGKTLQDLNVCQYTDIAIYIDNMVDTKALVKESDAMGVSTVETNDEAAKKVKEHTIKEMYIDNIKINSASNKGEKTLSYKNPYKYSEFRKLILQGENEAEQISEAEKSNSENNEIIEFGNQKERIDFNVVSTNADNEKSDYNEPIFYADCSNPITLNYMNGNIVMGYTVSEQDTQISFDGKILKSVGVSLDEIACTVGFVIHLTNNLDQKFTCGVDIEIPLKNQNKSIFDGYMYEMENNLQNKYKFFKK